MSTADVLTDDDLTFLTRPLLGFFSAAGGPDPAQPRPVWFEATPDGTVQIFTPPESAKVRRLRRDARASLIVAAPADETERWVAVTGPTTIEPDGADDLARRLAAQYWDLDAPGQAEVLAELLSQDYVRVVIHPERVRRYSN